jgi:hypothetical protein
VPTDLVPTDARSTMSSPGVEPPPDPADREGTLTRGAAPPDGHHAVEVPASPEVPEDVRGIVQAAVDALARARTVSVAALAEALESAARRLTRRVVADAVGGRDELADEARLRASLDAAPRVPAIGSATTAAMALRLSRRFRHLNFLAKRTPAFLLATAVPAVVASVSRGADELNMVAAHLVHRAHAAGVEPDLERVRRVAVQILSHHAVDPDTEPSHGRLAWTWIRRAGRAALPFTAGVATADPDGLAHAASDVDTATLAAR